MATVDCRTRPTWTPRLINEKILINGARSLHAHDSSKSWDGVLMQGPTLIEGLIFLEHLHALSKRSGIQTHSERCFAQMNEKCHATLEGP